MRSESEIKNDLMLNEKEHERLLEELEEVKILNGSYLDEWDKYIKRIAKVDENLYFVDCDQTPVEYLDTFARVFTYAVMGGELCGYELFVPGGQVNYTFSGFIEIIPDKRMKSSSLHPHSKFRIYNYAFRVDTKPENNEQIYYDDVNYDSTKKIYYEDERQKECRDNIMNVWFSGKKLCNTEFISSWCSGHRMYAVNDKTLKLESMSPSKMLRKIRKMEE